MKQQHTKSSNKVTVKSKTQKQVSLINIDFLKEEYLRWVFVIFTTIVSYIVLAWLITKIYVPDIDFLKEKAKEITFLGTNPEPIESLLYQIGLFFIPSFLVFLYWLSKNKRINPIFQKGKLILPVTLITSLVLLLIIYYGFAAANIHYVGANTVGPNEQDSIAMTNFDFYFHNLFLQKHFLLYTFFIFPLILSIFFGLFDKVKWDEKKGIHKFFGIVTWIAVGLLLLVIIPMNTFEFPYTWQNKIDFNAVYYSVTQVYNGSPMLIDGLSNTYGLYAQLLNPIFQIIGLSIYKFSLCMSILIGLCFVFQAFFLNKFTKNKLIFLLGCMSIFFLPFIDNKLMVQYDSSFAIFPIRAITFSTLLFISAFYIKSKNKILYFSGTVLFSLLLLWNPEMGLISFISWIALLVYSDFYTEAKTIAIKNILKNILIPIGILLVTCAAYSLIIKMIYGNFPNLIGMFKMILVFGGLGFNMLPMPLVHPWNLWALIFVIGLLYSIVKLIKKDINSKSNAIFLLSILGSGFFVYFVGRSHNWNFANFSGIGIILLTLLGDELWVITKNSKLLPFRILFSIFVFLISISIIELLAESEKIIQVKNVHKKDKISQMEESYRIKANQSFVEQRAHPKEKILVLTSVKYQGLYLEQNLSGANPGFIEFALHEEEENYKNIVRDSAFKIFIEPGYFYYGQHKLICANMAATYQLDQNNGSMALLTKRKYYPLHNEILLENKQNSIVHEVFQDNIDGFNKRAEYALGKDSIQLGNEFSVEIIFDGKPQIYQYATLISNQVDSAGFSILCADNQKTYYLTIGTQMFPVIVLPNQINYIVANVNNNFASVFVNGVQTGNYLLSKPYIESNGNLYIGNHDHLRYYLGAIQEVNLSKGHLSNADISDKWKLINSYFGH